MITISVSGSNQAELLEQLNVLSALISADMLATSKTTSAVDLVIDQAATAVHQVAEAKSAEKKATRAAKEKAIATVDPSDVAVVEQPTASQATSTPTTVVDRSALQELCRVVSAKIGKENVLAMMLEVTGVDKLKDATDEKLELLKVRLESM